MIQVVEGLGWPEERDAKPPDQYFAGMADGEVYRSEEIVAQLEALRDEPGTEWSLRRGVYNMAILIARDTKFWKRS
jgi:hypothetical protein